MELVELDGVALEVEVVGSGEPLLLIHGGFIADAFHPLLSEPRLTDRYRLIAYHRRGYAGSSRHTTPFSIADQAGDARELLRHLELGRAHVAGHSYGGAIACQLSLDTPEVVGTLALLEPAFTSLTPSGAKFMESLGPSVLPIYQRGERAEALDAFLIGVSGPNYREAVEKFLPPGAMDQAEADLGTCLETELPALEEWSFGAEDAERLRQPVLSVIGEESEPMFHEAHALIQEWIPHAEELRVPKATHSLQIMNPGAVAEGLARFAGAHPL